MNLNNEGKRVIVHDFDKFLEYFEKNDHCPAILNG